MDKEGAILVSHKKEKVSPFATTSMILASIILSEISQIQKTTNTV